MDGGAWDATQEEDDHPLNAEIVDDGDGQLAATHTETPAASVASTTFNIMKAILGSGCLALASGLAAVSNHKRIVLPGNLLFAALGGLSAYTFALYGRLCHSVASNSRSAPVSLGDLWKRVYGTNDGTPISLASFSFCYGCCLIFLLIIGDTISSLLQAAPAFAPGWMVQRQAVILSVMGTMLMPLCNLQSLAALAPVSVIGVLASCVSSAFVVWRCPALFATSPYGVKSGSLLSSLATHHLPQFATYSRTQSPAPFFVLLGQGGMALMAHFSASDFYQALAPRPPSSASVHIVQDDKSEITERAAPLHKYLRAMWLSFIGVGIINAMTLTCGFLTFGGNSAGMILNNYATADAGAALSRLLVAVSMIGGFPLLFRALQSSAADLLSDWQRRTSEDNSNSSVSPGTSRKLKFCLLASLSALAMLVKDAGFVVGLNGAVMGSAIIYLFPTLMFLRLTRDEPGHDRRTTGSRVGVFAGERRLCQALAVFGVLMAFVGGAATVLNAYFPNLLL